MHKTWRFRPSALGHFHINLQNKGKCDLSDFDHGIIVGARGAAFSSYQQSLEFTQSGAIMKTLSTVLQTDTPC